MPDITMCKGVRTEIEGGDRICPQRDKCYRHTAKPSERRQAWFMNAPLKSDDSCDNLMPLPSALFDK